MRIAEMEEHHDQYTALGGTVRTMLPKREFPAVFRVCEESFPHIVPAIKFRKKRGIEPETPALFAFRVINQYAPPLFEHRTIESLLEFVKSERSLAKHENGYLQAVESALEDEEIARGLWSHLETHPGFLQRDIRSVLGVSQERAVAIAVTWEQLGVITRRKVKNTYALDFRSRLDAITEGICQYCGVRGKGRKESFLKSTSCAKCGTEGYYHIVCTSNQ